MSGKVTHGADVEELDDIAVGLRRQGSKIADVGGRGAAQLEKLRALWDGPDFEKFAKDWRAAHRVIDDAESALRTYSRKLAAESDQQRQSSRVTGSPELAGTPRLEAGPAEQPPPVLRGGPAINPGPGGLEVEEKPRSGFTRGDSGAAFERGGSGGQVFERADPGPALQRVDDGGSADAWARVERLPDGRTGLVLDGADGPMALASPHGLLVTDDLVVTLPDLPGMEEIGADGTGGQPAFERMDAGAETSTGPGETLEQAPVGDEAMEQTQAPATEAPTQVATGDGAHVTTAADSAGQRSVSFDPRAVMSEPEWADASAVSGWLGLDGLDLTPWRTG